MENYSLGIDIGGTFTDVVVYDHATNTQLSRKILTTHGNPSDAVLEGVKALLVEAELDPMKFGRVVHATTLFTNALIERTGAKTGLITTEGFRDNLEIGRERKFLLYDLAIRKPESLVPRDLSREVPERVSANGLVLTQLDESALLVAADELIVQGVTSIAIVFLHSYLNPVNENRALALLREKYPTLTFTSSFEVAPEVREYERGSTATANAYIKPMAENYIDALAAKIKAVGIPSQMHLMISSGGLTHTSEAKRVPVQMLESGPAAGALAAAFFGKYDAGGNVLAFDMGGTTAKLSLVDDGEPLIAYGFEAARQKRFIEGSGLPIRISTIELIEIGSGGGSIAHRDSLGFLKVGPRSAGSEPGPAAYGLGGVEPTVTDAAFVLGYLNPDYFAGGMLTVDMAAAEKALDIVAAKVGLTRTEIAWGIHEIVTENMASAARVHIAERGRDPRDYALLCTGGAGPVHAYAVARKLGLRKIICPASAGVASALGLLVAPGRVDRVATVGAVLDKCDLSGLEVAFVKLEDEAKSVIAETGLNSEDAVYQRLADGRFTGQGFDLVVELPPGPYRGEPDRQALKEAFKAGYRQKFGRTPPVVPVEFLNIRVAGRASIPGGEVKLFGLSGIQESAVKGTRPTYFPDVQDYIDTKVYNRTLLSIGQTLDGPVVIEDADSTLVVGPGSLVEIAATGNIVVTMPKLEGK
jgi:N-methylhydantoinase A